MRICGRQQQSSEDTSNLRCECYNPLISAADLLSHAMSYSLKIGVKVSKIVGLADDIKS